MPRSRLLKLVKLEPAPLATRPPHGVDQVLKVAAGSLRVLAGFADFLQFGFESFAIDHGETSLCCFAQPS